MAVSKKAELLILALEQASARAGAGEGSAKLELAAEKALESYIATLEAALQSPEQERIIYTDEDGHERCHVGGCRLEVVSSDEGTSFYRPVPEDIQAAASEALGRLERRGPGPVPAPEEPDAYIVQAGNDQALVWSKSSVRGSHAHMAEFIPLYRRTLVPSRSSDGE